MDASCDLVQIRESRCNLCGLCLAVCRHGALAPTETSVILVHPDLCDGCAVCEEVCPEDAIECAFEIVWEKDGGVEGTEGGDNV